VIADSIELVGRSQPFDGLICLAGCDKTVPAAAMALVRLDVPGFVLYSGAMASGSHRGVPVTIKDVWEAVGAYDAGRISDAELAALERDACPGIGACAGQFTANTMAVAVDFLGLAPAGLGGVPATDPAKPVSAEDAGRLVLDVIARGARPSSFVTRKGLENAIVGVAREPVARRTPCCTCSRSPPRRALSSASRTSTASPPRLRSSRAWRPAGSTLPETCTELAERPR
jgi:dihydroxy-acid dehydratase